MTKQPGAITRIMCCTDEEKARYNHELLNLMPTHVSVSASRMAGHCMHQ